jgi:hypothetical protein
MEVTSYPAYNLIELEYADGGKTVFEIGSIIGLVAFNFRGGKAINVLLNGGHCVSVLADYDALVKRIWGGINAEMRLK